MKDTTKQTEHVFHLWDVANLTIPQIGAQKIPGSLSIKTIRNIVYGGPQRFKSEYHHTIQKIFRLKFLELQNVNKAIWFTYENQPDTTISAITVRRMINKKIRRKK